MSKNITIRIYNSSKHEIVWVSQFIWCGAFSEPPPAKVKSGEIGVCVIQRPAEADAVGGAVVYRMEAHGRDFMVSFDSPGDGVKSMTMTRVGDRDRFIAKQVIHDALWAVRTNFSQDSDHPDVISLAAITTDVKATCMAVVGDRAAI